MRFLDLFKFSRKYRLKINAVKSEPHDSIAERHKTNLSPEEVHETLVTTLFVKTSKAATTFNQVGKSKVLGEVFLKTFFKKILTKTSPRNFGRLASFRVIDVGEFHFPP
ncbi:MAG: hypothetical protein ABJP79_18725 [Tateyamaria sp.]|uniref:hypothetical protein n=1 Tax=Tateyamaria sp. TaxID=1929288 RepID=UPI00329BB9D9